MPNVISYVKMSAYWVIQAEKTAKEKAGITTLDSGEPPKYTAEQNEQARAYLQKYGRPISIPLMPLNTMKAQGGENLQLSYAFGVWRTTKSGSHFHGGHDFAKGLKHHGVKYHAPATGKVVVRGKASMTLSRNLSLADKMSLLHLRSGTTTGSALQGGELANPLQYGSALVRSGTPMGTVSNKGASDIHEHSEYHVRANDPRVAVRRLRSSLELRSYKRGAVRGNGAMVGGFT